MESYPVGTRSNAVVNRNQPSEAPPKPILSGSIMAGMFERCARLNNLVERTEAAADRLTGPEPANADPRGGTGSAAVPGSLCGKMDATIEMLDALNHRLEHALDRINNFV